jgi:hypothetical protein
MCNGESGEKEYFLGGFHPLVSSGSLTRLRGLF